VKQGEKGAYRHPLVHLSPSAGLIFKPDSQMRADFHFAAVVASSRLKQVVLNPR
jgi:hypothetical protein